MDGCGYRFSVAIGRPCVQVVVVGASETVIDGIRQKYCPPRLMQMPWAVR